MPLNQCPQVLIVGAHEIHCLLTENHKGMCQISLDAAKSAFEAMVKAVPALDDVPEEVKQFIRIANAK